MRRLVTAAVFVVASASVGQARALDPFEIQVYDGTSNPKGVPGLELHLNYVSNGVAVARPPELAQNHQLHATLEPSIGVTDHWELGGYFQTALRGDGTFDYAGVKLRSKLVWSALEERLRYGVNLEVSLLPERYDRNRWGGEVRPIVAFEDAGWLAAFNPILGVPLGEDASSGPTFEPALKVSRSVGKVFAFGLEYYGAFGPIASPDPWSQQRHYLYEVLDLIAVDHFELDVGVGEGLTGASDPFTMKLILGYEFEAPKAAPHKAARTPLLPWRGVRRF